MESLVWPGLCPKLPLPPPPPPPATREGRLLAGAPALLEEALPPAPPTRPVAPPVPELPLPPLALVSTP
eukprot:2797932-Prorocentrum_lima.AAC.1